MVKTELIPRISIGQGVEMPLLGLGTWKLKGNQARKAVRSALQAGYRHIDTASMYGNEAEIGDAIRESEVPRKNIFVTSKMWSDEKEDPRAALQASLRRLGLDYLDLYLIHWPSGNDLETWQVFEELYKEGLCRAIGVSNFDYELLKNTIVRNCNVKPMVNQIEMHPGKCNARLLRYAENHDIVITAYSPLAKASQLSNKVVTEIAEAHDKTSAQVMLRWSLEHGAAVIPKSAHEEHQKQNMAIFDFELSREEIRTLDRL